MAQYGRIRLARAAVYATALLAPLALGGCKSMNQSAHIGPFQMPTSGAPSTGGPVDNPTPSTVAPTNPTTPVAPAAPTVPSSSASRGPAAATGLTVFDGTSKVLINGTAVDFGTPVHDLAWSPDGKKAAFIDGGGNLDVANPDGSGRVEVAKNPGKEKWSRPTWQVTPPTPADNRPARDNLFFAVDHQGSKNLFVVPATAHDGTAKALTLNGYSGSTSVPPPTSGNLWPSAAGTLGTAVYEHDQGSTAQVYVRDDNLRQQGGKLFDGAEPALYFGGDGPGSYGLVFLRVVNGHKHVIREDPTTSTGAGTVTKATDLTPSLAVDATAPAWSPDGKTVAFSTPGGVELVAADGSGQVSQATTTPGVPAYRPVS